MSNPEYPALEFIDEDIIKVWTDASGSSNPDFWNVDAMLQCQQIRLLRAFRANHQRAMAIPCGHQSIKIDEIKLRAAQEFNLSGKMTEESRVVIDAVLSYFIMNILPK